MLRFLATPEVDNSVALGVSIRASEASVGVHTVSPIKALECLVKHNPEYDP